VRGILLGARSKTARESFQAIYQLAELIRLAKREWRKVDLLLLPTAGTTFKIAEMLAEPVELNTRLGAYTNFVNLMDLAALAVPAGFRPDGIPFGVTLAGPASSDGMLAAVGELLHRSLGGARLGATPFSLSSAPPVRIQAPSAKSVEIAVVGAHLCGQPLNGQLVERNATLIETTRTATGYRLYALTNASLPKPGLVFDGTGPGGIEVELWRMDEEGFGSFVASIPAPLGIGTLMLADGTSPPSVAGGRGLAVRPARSRQPRNDRQELRMSEKLLVAMAVVLGCLSVGAVLARQECKLGSVEWQVCTVLTKPGVRLGPILRF
jgi:allophanate hydrolase